MKRWVKILLIVAAIPLVAAGVVYYVLVHNLNQVLSYAIEKQTDGKYSFHSNDFRVSLFDKTVVINNSVLSRKDTTNAPAYYDVKIPKAFLSIESWEELLRHQRLLVDSLSIEQPDIVVHDYRVRKKVEKRSQFHTSMILENLQKTLDRLHAKSIAINNASFTLFTRRGAEPLAVKDVSLKVRNFLKIDNNDRHLFGSDDIELTLGRQRLILADGKNSLSFAAMRFRSATQSFEIDSVYFLQPATAERGETSLRADKFFFNSSRIPTIYQKSILSLDTLVCVRPVLRLPLNAPKKTAPKDTSIHSGIKGLFNFIDIGYTQIKDGQIVLGNNPAKQSGTERANLDIHNLRIDPRRNPLLTTDSIDLNLNNITFFSKDSVSKITVSSFRLRNNDVLFTNVRYGSALAQPGSKGLTFTAPALHLRQISLNELIRSELVASEAELVNPKIVLIATRKPPGKPVVTATQDTVVQKKTDIYQTLKRFGGLVQVKKFRIIDGSGQYQLAGATKPVSAQLKKLNATLLVEDLLRSEALIDIKHAVPDLRVGEMDVASAGTKIVLSNYRMDGAHRHNWVDKLKIDLATGTSLTANKIYWEAFSWDVLQQTKVIQIKQVKVQDLDIAAFIKPKSTSAVATGVAVVTQPKALPKLRIGRLLAQNMNLKADLPKETTGGFRAQGIRVDNLHTDAKFFHWAQLLGVFNDLYYKQPGGKQISLAKADLHSHLHTVMTDLQYADNKAGKTMEASVPEMILEGPIPSTDFSNINLTSLVINRPSLTMETEAKDKTAVAATVSPAKPFSIPLNIALGDFTVNQATVNYVTTKGGNATKLQTTLDVDAKKLRAKKHEDATFASLRVSPSNVKLETPKLTTTVPTVNVLLTNGNLSATKDGKPTLKTNVAANLTLRDLHPVLAAKNGKTPPELRAKSITGDINMPGFTWTAGQKLAWPSFVEHANLNIAGLSFKTAKSAIEAEAVRWSNKEERLELAKFSVTPTMSKAEFLSPPNLQSDYISVTGDLAQLNGVNAERWYRDSTLIVRHIVVKNVITDVSRDKRLPDPAVLPNKPMPTQLLSGVKIPFRIDSVSVVNSQVNYHETSKATNRVATVPLHNINGLLTTVTNRPTGTDSLKLMASTQLLGLDIRQLFYRESYLDSLSGFRMALNTSDLQMPTLNALTNPMAAVDLDGGYLDPITAQIAGNRYASVGNMRFHYRDLKIRLLGHKDSTKRSWLIKFENFAANKILRKKNDKDARIFYDRDQRKFIFGFWIKSIVSGVLASVGVKTNKKYHQKYEKLSEIHSLPAEIQ